MSKRIREADKTLKLALKQRLSAGLHEVEANLIKLVEWKPEAGFPHDQPLYGDSLKELNDAPFLSETYLYNLLGKNDARTLLAYMSEFARAVGYDGLWDLPEEVSDDDH